MGYRKFTDRDGHQWEVHDRTRSEWELVPVGGNPNRELRVEAPGYEADPFELSEEELQRLLGDTGGGGTTRKKKSPFLD
ncbi:MAG TPA: hypothetical protein VJ992_09780 [Gemmatimonadales bacterium]|nr:hypothetical protein [Gemmatimonadales bacterium]